MSTVNSSKNCYTNSFYEYTRQFSQASAQVIVPLILKILPCERVVDIGCGDGTWLKIFQDNHVKEILGVDGEYVKDSLVINEKDFISFNLKEIIKFSLIEKIQSKKFDLALSPNRKNPKQEV